MWLKSSRFITLLSLGGLLLGIGAIADSVNASEDDLYSEFSDNYTVIDELNPIEVNESEIIIVNDDDLAASINDSSTASTKRVRRMVNPYFYRKKNVKTYTEWSPYKRVSDNLKTGSSGGSITTTKSVTFGVTVSGDIYGLGISQSGSISSSTGYTLKVGKNKRVYVGYRVKYKVEKGIREHYDVVTGKVRASNSYTVKVPQYGEYALINYKK